ncbi:MAG TPA: T9SS type A sorting domain-containing protein, partial [Bacteroidetes bacterium]|nr:T9SS type A sorting domain-containing protein [Bacteroidota bacterium]
FTFVEPDAISITANIRPATCQNASNGAIDLSIAGGCAPYAANWTGPFGFTASSEDLAGLYAGFYQLSLTDANGCTATFADSVSIYNDLSASLGCCQDTAICAGQTVALQVDLTGSGPWFLTWSDGLQNQVDFVLNSPHTILVSPNITTTYSLVSMSQDTTDCRGEVCGSATVAVNACDSSDCADLCVNAGVINHWDQGNCRTVVLELACDTLCNNKSAIKSTGQCFGMRTFHFNQDDSGNPLAAGTVVGSQWNALGITILVTNNNGSHPQKGVIFDSGNPTGGDADLGTPHQDFGGPGIGLGGALGALGQNDVALGNLLVIADNELDVNMDGLIDDPGDEAAGGEIRINFARPFYVESLTLVDLDNGNGFIRVAHHGSQTTDFSIPGWGDNAVTAVPIALDSVHSVRVVLPGSGGIAALAYCPLDSAPEYVDISIPCGTLSSFSNSLNLPMELIAQDSLTGLSGLRVHGLPSYCQDTAGLGPFTVTYEVCNAPCAADFCPPLLAYTRNGCTQYETARMGTVLAPPGSNSKTPLPGNGRVEVFPNPVREMATFRLLTKYDCAATLELYNLNGILVEQVWQGDLLSEKEKSIRFERGNLPIGIYILRLRTSREEGFVRKFIVVN